ncbi:hypothetical protein EMCRGX_G031469 [Ephydatia muelleri]
MASSNCTPAPSRQLLNPNIISGIHRLIKSKFPHIGEEQWQKILHVKCRSLRNKQKKKAMYSELFTTSVINITNSYRALWRASVFTRARKVSRITFQRKQKDFQLVQVVDFQEGHSHPKKIHLLDGISTGDACFLCTSFHLQFQQCKSEACLPHLTTVAGIHLPCTCILTFPLCSKTGSMHGLGIQLFGYDWSVTNVFRNAWPIHSTFCSLMIPSASDSSSRKFQQAWISSGLCQ